MTSYCSWCGLYMGLKSPIDDPSVSHGICLLCSREVIEAARRMEKQTRIDNNHLIATNHLDDPNLVEVACRKIQRQPVGTANLTLHLAAHVH